MLYTVRKHRSSSLISCLRRGKCPSLTYKNRYHTHNALFIRPFLLSIRFLPPPPPPGVGAVFAQRAAATALTNALPAISSDFASQGTHHAIPVALFIARAVRDNGEGVNETTNQTANAIYPTI